MRIILCVLLAALLLAGTGFAAENAAEASDQMFSPFVRYHLMDSLPVLTPV